MSAVQKVARRTLYTSMRQFARSFEAHPQPISMTGSQPGDWGRIVRTRGQNLVLYSGFMSAVLFWPAAARWMLDGRV
ncbi:uncharacterized protein B0I36DRAFT_365455 [Microdochium trichocladiopsis]|uniref:Uncharacterized protein n=1 Tax=Microdochium trichocladiopsis TaxID=1682393 RepID=A0A9P8Y254_9PEZI|nr:uncharacterized protein B0I36DRAFT_365455 [Microdochium trichocladiopsis]KAH7025792.1 hypothetical protein B0I36DRAFT_365455 [Microdochium trichocladiopsis]